MKVLHLLAVGGVGGIESLIRDYSNLSTHENIYMFVWGSGVNCDAIKKKGHSVIELNASKKDFLNIATKLYNLCKDEGIEAIVEHHTAPLLHLLVLLIRLRFKHIKFFAYAHSNAEDFFKPSKKKMLWLRGIILQKSFASATKIIAISNSVKNSIINTLKITDSRIEVIYNGVELSKFDCNKNIGQKLNILYVGRLIKEKGVAKLLETLALLNIPYKCLIVGDGPERENLTQLKESLGLIDENIEFCGAKRDIPNWHNKADIFVHPAIWEEGFGITLVEAMASGLPCVAFKKGAIPEIIQDGKNGFIVEKDTPEELAKAIEKIYNIKNNEPEKWEAMQKNAVERSKDFSIEKMVEGIDKLLEGKFE